MSAILHCVVVGIENDRIKENLRTWLINTRLNSVMYSIEGCYIGDDAENLITDCIEEANEVCDDFNINKIYIRKFKYVGDLYNMSSDEIIALKMYQF